MAVVELTVTVEHADLSRDAQDNLILHTYCDEDLLNAAVAKYHADMASNPIQVEANRQRDAAQDSGIVTETPAPATPNQE